MSEATRSPMRRNALDAEAVPPAVTSSCSEPTTRTTRSSGTTLLSLRIKSTYSSSSKDDSFVVELSLTDSVAQLKQRVLQHLQVEPSRYVRLICQGRLLAPDAASLESFAILKQASSSHGVTSNNDNTTTIGDSSHASLVVHAVVAAAGQTGGMQAVLQQHCQHDLQLVQGLRDAQNNNGLPASTSTATRLRRLSEGLLRGAGVGRDGRLVVNSNSPSNAHDSDRDDSIMEDDDEDDDDMDESSHLMMPGHSGTTTSDLIDLELGVQTPYVPNPNNIVAAMRTNNRRRQRRQSGTVQSASMRMGFDRLRHAPWSLSNSQVQAIRAYFSLHVDDWLQNVSATVQDQIVAETLTRINATRAGSSSNTLDPAQDPALRRQLLEDAWMEAQGPVSEFWLNLGASSRLRERRGLGGTSLSSILLAGANHNAATATAATVTTNPLVTGQAGTDRDFRWGFIMGFFVGFVMLAWVWMPNVPHKQKLGILTGITVQLALTMLQKGNGDEMAGDVVEYDDVGLLKEY